MQIPTWRLDVEREIDLIEEIGRIYGYLKLPNTLPAFAGAVVPLPNAEKHALLRQRLLALGYNESVSSTFIAAEDARAFSNAEPVRLENPVSEEAACLRSSLLPGITAQMNYNLNRGNNDVRLFESGDIFERPATGWMKNGAPSLPLPAPSPSGAAWPARALRLLRDEGRHGGATVGSSNIAGCISIRMCRNTFIPDARRAR